MRKLAYVLLGLALALVTAPACGGSSGTGPGGGNGNGDGDGNGDGNGNGSGSVAATVTMDNTAFIDPTGGQNTSATVTIQVGEAVRWVNEDNVDHTVTSGEGTGGTDGDGLPDGASSGMDSPPIGPGGDFEFTFDTPGTWTYYCEIHPGIMYEATVIVEE